MAFQSSIKSGLAVLIVLVAIIWSNKSWITETLVPSIAPPSIQPSAAIPLDLIKSCRKPVPPDDDVPRLRVETILRSSKQPSRKSLAEVTLVTHLTPDRLRMLEHQCLSWSDAPISAAVYLQYNTEENVSQALYHLTSMLKLMDYTKTACRLDMAVVISTDVNEPKYPYNALRNIALDLASTDIVALIDVDFMPSIPKVQGPVLKLLQQGAAVVAPAFEAVPVSLKKQTDPIPNDEYISSIISDAAATDALKQAVQEGRLQPFSLHRPLCPSCHTATDFPRWLALDLKQDTEPYRISYDVGFEPYVLLWKEYAPWYDERFIGYGGNKQSYLAQLHGLGLEFYVHPEAFVIHMTHPLSRDMLFWHSTAKQDDSWRSKVANFLFDLLQNCSQGLSYVPVTSFYAHDSSGSRCGSPLKNLLINHLANARDYVENGEYTLAVDEYIQYIRVEYKDSERFTAAYELAQLVERVLLRDLKDTQAVSNNIIEQLGNHLHTSWVSDIEESEQDTRKISIKTYIAASLIQPSRPEPRYQIARLYRQLEDYEQCFNYASTAAVLGDLGKAQHFDEYIYSYAALHEVCVCAYYVDKLEEGKAACEKLIMRITLRLEQHPHADNTYYSELLELTANNMAFYNSQS